MRGVALLGIAGSAVLLTVGVIAGRGRVAAAHANIRRYSMPGARSYDLVARLLFAERYRDIAGAIAAEVPAGSRLLDAGCGPGEVLVRLATLAPAIETTGLDVDGEMIERANRKADRAVARGAGTRPSFVVADAASMPFADASFDVVVSSFAIHHWPDRGAGMAEMLRVLRPGGRAIVWDIASPHAAPGADDPHAPAAHRGHAPGHGSHGEVDGDAPAPQPSLLSTFRMLILFRRLPAERYDFVKPEA